MVSAEAVVAANPDIIIIADMERMSRNEIRRWSRFRNMSAIRNNAIYIIDGYAIGSPTPVSFIETVEKIRGKINRN
jgi:ABC-type Fe3+-hydroxamate transport system substrate-binding protein